MEKENNDTANRRMHITKLLDAPIGLVWEVWTNPEHIVNWWGPNGFTSTIHTMNLTAGSEWHFNPNYIATILFEPKGEQTLLDWTGLFETTELFETVIKVFKADVGLRQNVEKLEKYLNQKQQ